MGFFESLFEGCDKIVVVLTALALLGLGVVLTLVAEFVASLLGLPSWMAGLVMIYHIYLAGELIYIEFFG